jgi:glycerol-3-phosphate acyltransferase PlsX
MDPRRANGGVFLGLNGIVIKSHGGADAEGYAAAIDVGHGVVRDELLDKIKAMLARHRNVRSDGSQSDKSQIGSSQVLESKVLENKAVGGAAS